MKHWIQKVGVVAGVIVGVAGQVQEIPGLPPKVQSYAALAGSIAAIVSALYHPKPGAQPAAAPATAEPAGV